MAYPHVHRAVQGPATGSLPTFTTCGAASTQLQGMTDSKTAAGRLGHSPKVMLETYAHGIAERDAAASVALGDVITKALMILENEPFILNTR